MFEAVSSLFDFHWDSVAINKDSEDLSDEHTAIYIAHTETIFVVMWKGRLDRIVSRLSLQMSACASYSCLTASFPVTLEHSVKSKSSP